MREGILIPDMQSGRADIRFSSDDCYGGLHCGTTMDIWLNERWVPTHIEMDSCGWFLVGVQVETLWGRRCAYRGDQTAIRSKAGCKAVNFADAIPVSWSQGIASSLVSSTGIRSWTLMMVSLGAVVKTTNRSSPWKVFHNPAR